MASLPSSIVYHTLVDEHRRGTGHLGLVLAEAQPAQHQVVACARRHLFSCTASASATSPATGVVCVLELLEKGVGGLPAVEDE